MRLRLFGTLLAAAALAACSGDTFLPVDEQLVGSWRSAAETVTLLFPDGPRPVTGTVEVQFTSGHRFHREERFVDPANPGVQSIQAVEDGSYTVAGGRVIVHLERAYYRAAAAEPTPNISLQPTDRTDAYNYAIAGTSMTFVFVCPPNANCIEPQYIHYTLVTTDTF